ncbi:MAG TPA: glycerophosphodiester phosphodiesterase family protein [Spirochaetales bacterium]|nr:glycerophosphodiester phosphodiesterase family protein [Spirochaetales bacterium]
MAERDKRVEREKREQRNARGWIGRALPLALAVVAVLALVLYVLDRIPFAPGPGGANPLRVEKGELPLVVPHGGAKRLYPENTILSYRMMAERGWTNFEIDLALSADGVLVSHHDLSIKATTGEDRPVRELSYAELTTRNFGVNFTSPDGSRPYADTAALARDDPALLAELAPARLDALFAAYPEASYILELKDTFERTGAANATAAAEALAREIDSAGVRDRVVVASFEDASTAALRAASGGSIATAAASDEVLVFAVLSALGLDFFLKPGYSALLLPIEDRIKPKQRALVEKLPAFLRDKLAWYDPERDEWYTRLVDRRIVEDARRHGVAVHYWTVNDEETMRELVALGVDGIITDRPDLLEKVYAELGAERAARP